jgi:hypothetical protein
MALPNPHPLNEVVVYAFSPSVGATPIAARAVSPVRGRVIKTGSVLYGAITTADAAIAVAINGTAVTNGGFTITQASSAAGDVDEAIPTGANLINEGDQISFTPSGASGSSIGANFYAVIRMT